MAIGCGSWQLGAVVGNRVCGSWQLHGCGSWQSGEVVGNCMGAVTGNRSVSVGGNASAKKAKIARNFTDVAFLDGKNTS